ncbi:MAG TPA: hypothetical protein VNA24_00215 [Hyalangium sp.]|nr:hypothetical protein [Hyalangium sp.]
MKKLFHVLVVGGAVIGTGAGCTKPKATEAPAAPPAQEAPGTTAPTAAPSTPTAGSDAPGTPAAPPAPAEEKGGGAGSW